MNKPRLYLIYISLVLSLCACIPDDDDISSSAGSETFDSTLVIIDSAFTADKEFLVGEWRAEYLGFDANPRQQTLCKIQRHTKLHPDGSYDNYVRGLMLKESDSTEQHTQFIDFEHEHGTYLLIQENRMLYYQVEYDSLVNFLTGKLEYNPGKLRVGEGILSQYEESIWFTPEHNRQRRWVRFDETLRNAEDSTSALYYMMSRLQ
ncbi:MAG: hypothetical protein J5486_10985 [Bacteroidaceae bacterium]|nr:hypothetical protein [Bacteroidaceae bacterium]